MGFFDRFERFLDDVLFLPDEVRVTLAAAGAALEEGLFAEAADLYRDILAERTLPSALVGLARSLTGLGDHDGALEALARARTLLPEDAELASWAARAALELGRWEDAASAARDAARSLAEAGGEPFAEACTLVALAEWRGGRPDRAARELRKALVSAPTPVRRALLVEALAAAGLAGAARSVAATLMPDELAPQEALRLGKTLIELGEFDVAESLLTSAIDRGVAEAGVWLAETALARGDLMAAELLARQAVAKGVGTPALATLGEVLVALGREEEAARAWFAAAQVSGDLEALRSAARVAPRELLAPCLERGELESLEEVSDLRAFVTGENVEAPRSARGWLARARSALAMGAAAEVLAALDAWEALRDRASRADVADAAELRRAALRATWRAGEDVDLAGAIDAVLAFAEEHALPDVGSRARALRDELDRPLLLGVLGEFNAGKSTLINAFIGAEVAPMGVVPTTATLNVLRGGAERRVRLVLHDGSTREGGYAQLDALLEEAESAGVDRVEIVLPSETLERVWILDAPGTNALDPRHEELAQEAARRADAVLWIFDAAQAGKSTETRVHEALRARGRLVVPVLNKVDRLKAGEIAKVRGIVSESFGAEPLAVSARRALQARVTGDDASYEESGFVEFLAALDGLVFSRARGLKRAACAGRLAEALDEAFSAEEAHRVRSEAARASAVRIKKRLLRLGPELTLAVDDALRVYERELDDAFDAAAAEVLAFVRPRASRLSRHGAHPEDRAFLAELLERRLREAIERCERRLSAQLRGRLAEAEGSSASGERLRELLRPALAAHWGFQRGVLEGGTLRRFFAEVLPRAELDAGVLVAALSRGRVDSATELRPALIEVLEQLQRERIEVCDDTLRGVEEETRRVTERVFGPLRALYEVLREIAVRPTS